MSENNNQPPTAREVLHDAIGEMTGQGQDTPVFAELWAKALDDGKYPAVEVDDPAHVPHWDFSVPGKPRRVVKRKKATGK